MSNEAKAEYHCLFVDLSHRFDLDGPKRYKRMNKMKPTESITTVPPDVMADAQAVVESVMSGKPLDPVIARRVHERAREIKEAVYQKHGLLDLAVPAIRDLRGELPNP
jgi:hypothetical protein